MDTIISPSIIPTTKFKSDRAHHHLHHHNNLRRLKITFLALIALIVIILYFFISSYPINQSGPDHQNIQTRSLIGSSDFSKRVLKSAKTQPDKGGSMSVLVTGAAGFVGAHVSVALKQRGDGVVGLDSFNSYYEISLKKSRQMLVEKYGVFIVEGDVNDQELLKMLFGLVQFTHVMHLAAQAGVRYAMQNPKSYINSNILGFVSVLEVSKNVSNPPSIVWASSSSVYGLNTKVPFSEIDRTDRPASLYAASKKAGEEIAHTYNHIYGLSITGLRFFTVYGPWGRPDMAYFFFTNSILKGKQIKVFEGAKGELVARDFTYISDIVKGCLRALDTAQKSTAPGFGGKKKGPAQLRVYNLGNTTPVPIKKVVMILENILKKKAKKKVMKIPANGDVPFTHANISLAKRELGYRPSVDIKTGLKSFVRWYVEYYKVPGYEYMTKKKDARSTFTSL